MTDRTFLSVQECADTFGISTDQVYKLLDSGELPSIDLAAPGSARRRRVIPAVAVDMVVERLLEGWSPDRLVARLGGVADPSSSAEVLGGVSPRGEGSTRRPASSADVLPMRRRQPG